MIRDILKMGDPRLLRVAKPVEDIDDPALPGIIQDMRDTLADAKSFGLAAPQIAVDLRILIFGFQSSPFHPTQEPIASTTLINPWIEILTEDEEESLEGCLSVPGMRAAVPRFTHIRYGGTLLGGESLEREVTGFHARLFQHEYDHLDGILYPMKIRDMSRFGFAEAFPEGYWDPPRKH